MTYQCPKCELRFGLHTVLEYHLRTEHPDAQADYPTAHPADENWPLAHEPKRYSWRPTYPTRHTP